MDLAITVMNVPTTNIVILVADDELITYNGVGSGSGISMPWVRWVRLECMWVWMGTVQYYFQILNSPISKTF